MAKKSTLIMLFTVVFSLLSSILIGAEEPVYFADEDLKAAVEQTLGASDPTPSDMLSLTELYANIGVNVIDDLTGLQYAHNLQVFWLCHQTLSDLSPLSGLTKLQELDLHADCITSISALSGLVNLQLLFLEHNQISDISPLAGLANLEMICLFGNQINNIAPLSSLTNLLRLNLGSNQISDISPLAELASLYWLDLQNNQISDISALSGLTKFQYLDLRGNPLNLESYSTYIPLIIENNPGIALLYDPAPTPPEKTLPEKAAELAKEVTGADYLWGGKGYDFNSKMFVPPEKIKTTGYYYWNPVEQIVDFAQGVDCSGLTFWAYNRSYYSDEVISWQKCVGEDSEAPLTYEGADGQYRNNTYEISQNELKVGDLLFFDAQADPYGTVDHVAMYVGQGKVVHAEGVLFKRIVEEDIGLILNRYKEYFKGFRRLKEVEKPDMIITGKSPIDLVVTDPDGMRITRDLGELPGMYYTEYPVNGGNSLNDVIAIPSKKPGDYLIIVVPEPDALPTDTFTLQVTTGDETIVLAENVLISNIPDDPYIVRSIEDGIIPIIPATVDFDPDTLNLRAEGKWITVYIELPVGHGYDVSDINVDRTFLEGLLEVKQSEIQDGVLMVKFDRQEVIFFLEVFVDIIPPYQIPLTVTGELKDGRRFEGSDTIRVIDPRG